MASGLSNEGIARQLHLGVKSVESISRSVFQKLGLGEEPKESNRRVKAVLLYLAHITDENGRLPVPITPFVGRAELLASTAALLGRVRFVTLTGIGGVGKSRLAIELAARHMADGGPARFVDLAPCTSRGSVAAAFLSAFGAPSRERFGRYVSTASSGRELIVVVDNAEHVVAAVLDWIPPLLNDPNVTLVVTSRRPLDLDGETVRAVPPMSAADAVHLLTARATHRVDHRRAAALCDAVGRIPLALEMVSAQLRAVAADALLDRPDALKAVVGRDGVLAATLTSTMRLLNSAEARALRLLSGLPGGFELEAAAAIVGGRDIVAVISRLTGMALVEFDGVRRYRMLEPIRQLMVAALVEAGELGDFHRALIRWVIDLANGAVSNSDGSPSHPGHRRLTAERAVIETALVAALDVGDHLDALRILGPVGWWCAASYPTGWLLYVEKALAAVRDGDDAVVVGWGHLAAGIMTATLNDSRCEEYFDVAERLLRSESQQAAAMYARYWNLRWNGGSDEAFEAALAHADELGDTRMQAFIWGARAHHGFVAGKPFDQIEPWFLRSIELGRRSSRSATLVALQWLAGRRLDVGRPVEEIEPLVTEMDAVRAKLGDFGGLDESDMLRGRLLLRLGHTEAARERLAAAIGGVLPTESASAMACYVLYGIGALDGVADPARLDELRRPAAWFIIERFGEHHPVLLATATPVPDKHIQSDVDALTAAAIEVRRLLLTGRCPPSV